jgi:hypothetical protein
MGLTIPFDPTGLDPIIVHAFDDLIATLQTWANTVQTTQGSYVSSGFATYLGQHRLRLSSSTVSVPNVTEYPIPFTAPTRDDLNTYDVGDIFDGTATVYLTTPGLYLVTGRIRWDANAAGTFRILQLRIDGDDAEFVTANAPVAAMTQYVTGVIPVTDEILASMTQRRLTLALEAAQDSGGTRTPTYVWFSVIKLS